jgi:peptide chain release factor 1
VKQSLINKLQQLVARSEELGALLSDPDIIQDQNRFRDLSKEYAQLEPVIALFRDYEQARADQNAAEEMLKDADAEIRSMGKEELETLKGSMDELEFAVRKALIPKDPHDDSNIYLEIRAGTGGDEAAIFVGNLFRMYSKYADAQGWQLEIINANEGEHGGYKEIISRIIGKGAYSRLKFESGAHRVQRVPETEAQGRIHTSACTVAVLPEPG